jgi:hypothetical protein
MMWGVDGGEKVAQKYAGEQRERRWWLVVDWSRR